MAKALGFLAYADGSCLGNPGPGGWGVVLIDGQGQSQEFWGAAPSTTNNRMEITAAIEALRHVPSGAPITIRSDSQYVIKTMTLGWKRRENLDLWPQLDAETVRHKVRWEWVRGHSGNRLNERADELARNAALDQSKGPDEPAESLGSPSLPTVTLAGVPEPAIPNENESSTIASELEIAPVLRPLLREGESLRRCSGCGRVFVATGQPPPMMAYCALAACQLKYRSMSKTIG
jgi:ribonuclease HI